MSEQTPPERIRLALLSEVSFSEGDPTRPIHALRTGTFTGMSGQPSTFEPKHLRQMAQALNEMAARRRPPINENHDYGRAVGRMMGAFTRNRDNDLYITPKWLTAGRTLLSDDVYDGFSIELNRTDDGWEIVGGALTNYPAVSGLASVTLSAPPPDFATEDAPAVPLTVTADGLTRRRPIAPEPAPEPAAPADDPSDPPVSPAPAPARVPVTQEESILMPDIIQSAPEPTAAVDVELSASEQAKIDRLVALREAEWKQREQLILQEAEARFERRMADERARRDIESYAQHITTPTLARPHALPGQTATYAAFLSSLSSEQRKAAQGLFDGILAAGLVSYAEIGSSGEGPGAGDTASEWAALVSAKVQAGMTRTAAIAAAARENPDLYAAQSAPKKGGK